ncbi:MAG: YihY/virulence factor BrkB family protein [Chitinophagaceae bacterium]|nr:YihY/virulence factor BrkB family protein [Chitinophagaceae bacterium]
MKKISLYLRVLRKAFSGFIEDNAFKLSASLSYYTIFAMGPLLLIIMSLAGIFFGREAVQGKIYGQIKGLVGNEAAVQVQSIIQNISLSQHGTVGAIIGFIVLIIGATGVFTEIQDSINFIWSVKAKPKKGWLKFLINRLISFSLVVSMGFILLVSLTVNALMDILSDKLLRFFKDYTIYLFYVINVVIIFVIITGLFTVIFKVLPDAKIKWREALVGAGFTAMLFLIGKFLIGYYLGRSDMGITFGAAASIVLILSWVYYSSLILYFGAEFTKVYAIETGSRIVPNDTAVFIIKKEAKEIPTSYLDT